MSDGAAERRDREERAMQRAIELARAGLGRTSPNPSVGCVILSEDGQVVGEGQTAPVGGPHAEVVALRAAGEAARGATAVVTLEPCNHTGRTGPCAKALLDAGIRRVVYAVPDPDPIAAGGGRALAESGVQVEYGLLHDEAAHVARAWLVAVRTGRPHVLWKLAATLDGRSAAADGTSQWITSAAARADVHVLRSQCDAIVVGVGTVLADDPHLTVRDPAGALQPHQPLRVVLDADARTPERARVRDAAAPTLVLTASEIGRGAGGRGVDLSDALAVLFARGVRSVLLEGGPRLAGAFIDAGLVDQVAAYIAPSVLGRGRAALETDTTGATIAAIARLHIHEVHRVGPDLRIDLVRAGEDST